ncbi:ABC transporter ATP-binding protein [Pimelobacter simplex]|uniref:ABC-type quaternary amine transporter n=1 Tax=Nocardioides simplex TaxID=2045 RepID=A0A7J5E3T8_NOCSI|nr:ABC transporter ATP-binding protein [Pimelobacter simplex]KAB2812926.1 ABC transporter ATP-binding protein [Pimelobacter simplex]
MSTFISVAGAAVRYGRQTAVRSLDLDVPEGALVTLLGPSGCGKTTTLRTIAGLERLAAGEVRIGDKVVDAPAARTFVGPERRSIGMVFQNYALWPQMTVRQNVAYPMKIQRVRGAERRRRTDELLGMMGLDGYADRTPARLSGGQQQRVAIARALARDPRVLLFDEPLSNLDARLRRSLRAEIRKVHQDSGTTSLFVTHDHEEALAVSDYVGVMLDGDLVQFGDPVEVYSRPTNRRIADFFGFDNLIDVTPDAAAQVVVATGTGAVLPVRSETALSGVPSVVALRRDQVRLADVDEAPGRRIAATVETVAYVGGLTEFDARYDGLLLRGSVDDVTLRRHRRSIPVPGEQVDLVLPEEGVALFRGDGDAGSPNPSGPNVPPVAAGVL